MADWGLQADRLAGNWTDSVTDTIFESLDFDDDDMISAISLLRGLTDIEASWAVEDDASGYPQTLVLQPTIDLEHLFFYPAVRLCFYPTRAV